MAEYAAQARIALANPEAVVLPLCAHLVEHGGELQEDRGERVVRFPRAQASFRAGPGFARVAVSAASVEDLYFLRMMIASHMLEFAGAEAGAVAWRGDGDDLMHPPNFRILQILDCRDLTPRMRRITFAGSDLERFAPMTALHLNILIQHPELSEPQWPGVGPDGLIRWQDPQRRPWFRKYTVRKVDAAAGQLQIDFVRHADGGPGSGFAAQARPGDRVGVLGPGGGGLVDADWYLFAGDETALPAIARMLEHLPASARGRALIEVADQAEIQPLVAPAAIEVQWLCRDSAPTGTTALLGDAVRRIALPRDGSGIYAWAGCEYAVFRDIRRHWRSGLGLAKQQHLAVAYWRRGKSAD